MNRVKEHFETEAHEFDGIIVKLIPYYSEMVKGIVAALPFPADTPIRVLDLGCGTGTVARRILDGFPAAQLTCLDFSAKMIEMARIKLKGAGNARFVTSDFREFPWDDRYDAVVSSLALHHLVTDEEKREFYGRVFGGLKHGGCFYNADMVLASSTGLQDVYMERWKEFMCRSVPRREVEERWLRAYRAEDHPAPLSHHLEWMREAGFQGVDVLWKYYNFAVFGGTKG